MYVCMYLCIYVSIYVCMYVCIYVSMYLCIYVSMYLCIYIYIYILLVNLLGITSVAALPSNKGKFYLLAMIKFYNMLFVDILYVFYL